MVGHTEERLKHRVGGLLSEFSLNRERAIELIEATERTARAKRLGDCLVAIAKSDKQVAAQDGSNGDLLCIILRQYNAVTVMLRRDEQGDLNELKLYKLKGV